MNYEAVIGLEVHLHLNTRTKAFCGCATEFGKEPNSQVCPVCLGFPGSLPVFNRTALDYAIGLDQNWVPLNEKHREEVIRILKENYGGRRGHEL